MRVMTITLVNINAVSLKVCLANVCMHEYLLSAITLDNTLVILSTVAPDAGRYYAQAVNDKNGENKTSLPIMLTVESRCTHTHVHTHSPTHRWCMLLQMNILALHLQHIFVQHSSYTTETDVAPSTGPALSINITFTISSSLCPADLINLSINHILSV